MIVTMQDYTITDRAPVLIGYEGENLSRNFTVKTFDDLSAIASIELLIGDVNCGAMTVNNTDDTEITISLDAFMIGRAGYKKAQLIMLDDSGAVIMKSNQFDVLVGASNNPRYYVSGEKVKTLTVNIDGRTRQIILPAGFAVSVNGDVAVDHIAFKAPASYGDFDFSAAACRVDWTGVDGTSHTNICTEKDADGNWIWALPTALTRGGEGEISFSVSYIVTDATTGAVTADWNTGLVKFYHLESAKSDDAEEDVEEETTYDRLASAIAAVRAAQASVDDVNAILAGITSATPTVVDTVADLNSLDTSKVKFAIVAADGYLYYYDGTTWKSGFAYGGLQEVIAARTDSDGVTHADLKTRLNTAEAQIKEDLTVIGYVAPASGRYTGNNLLPNPLHESGTRAGITYTWDTSASTWTVTGTSTGTAFTNLYNGLTTLSLPDGIEAGKTYYVEYEPSDKNIEIDYQWYDANKTKIGDSRTPESMYITVPENTVGCVIRIRVWSGNTANGTAPNPRIYLAVDNTSDIINALTTNGHCTLGRGDYYVYSITMPNNTTLSGIGDGTIIHNIYKYHKLNIAIIPTNGCTVENLKILGSDNVPDNTGSAGYIVGVKFENAVTSAVRLCNLTISNCDRYGIDVFETGGNTRGGVIITGAKINNCWCGIRFTAGSEYNKVSNSIMKDCNTGCINNGGNNTFTSCTFHGVVGFLIDGTSANSGHGTCVGCTFNHIDNTANPDTLGGGRAVSISSLINGFVFDACQFWYGAIFLSNSKGVTVCNSQMGDGVQNPHITVTGSYPAFFNDVIFHQTPIISDSASSKFTACYLDSDGSAVTGQDA